MTLTRLEKSIRLLDDIETMIKKGKKLKDALKDEVKRLKKEASGR